MKIKMVKMGMDIDETRNCRIRGIVPTKDNKYLFIEILKGDRPKRIHTSLSQKQYEEKYPNEEYIWIDFCFRVDIPKEYYDNYSPEFSYINGHSYYELAHSKENIIKLLQRLNKDIQDMELVKENYIDKFCEEKGFFKLYDDRLKHSYKPIQIIWSDLRKNGDVIVKTLYTCFAANGTEYSKELEIKTTMNKFMEGYEKKTVEKLVNDYIEKECQKIEKPELIEEYQKAKKEIFEERTNELEIESEYTDI